MRYKKTIILITVFLSLAACKNHHKGAFGDLLLNDPYKKLLIQQSLGKSQYTIALPKDYVIKEFNGIDFDVYSFYARNKTDSISYFGGIYMGGHTATYMPDSACRTDSLQSAILGDIKKWTVYNCNNRYTIEIVTPSKSGFSWCPVMRAFGHARSKIELHKLLVVYSTLKRK